MKKILSLVVVAILALGYTVKAQDVEMPKYQRSSLHMVLLTTDEPTLDGAEDFTKQLDEAWQGYPFPDKYNEHAISYTQAYGGKPKGSLMELITRFQNGFDNLSIADAKQLLVDLKSSSKYEEDLISAIQNINETEKIGNQLIRKWFNIQDDGSWDYELIKERAAYNANQAAVAEAEAVSRGVQAIFDQGEDLIANTFVTFSKLSFYENEPIAAFSKNLALFIASQTPAPASNIMITAAEAAYAATSKGYSAKATTALYKLEWTEEIKAAFYEMFTADNKIDMEKFNAYTFPMSLVGIQTGSSSTFDAKGGLAEAIGIEGASKPDDALINETIIRNIDKLFAKMQKLYEVFAPVSQIVSVDPLMADIGMKEGIEGGEKFNLLEPVLNEKTNKIEWKSIGVVTVDKKGVWDNRYSLTDKEEATEEATEETAEEAESVKGSVLSANKKAAVGMVVKQVVKKKK